MASINTNVKALAAQSSMSNVDRSLQTSMQRLSTGLRINNAKDDAAGLAISNRMSSDIRGFAVAIRNANDGLSMAQTADGALGQVTDMLQRMRELAVQAGNGSLNADNRSASQLEIDQLKQQIDNIATQTNFNSINLLDGSAGNIKLQTNVRANQQMTMSIDSAQTKDIGLGSRASLTATGFVGTTSASAVSEKQIITMTGTSTAAAAVSFLGVNTAALANIGDGAATVAAAIITAKSSILAGTQAKAIGLTDITQTGGVLTLTYGGTGGTGDVANLATSSSTNGVTFAASVETVKGSVTSISKNMAAGDLIINGVNIPSSQASSDTVSYSDKASSAIAKVAAINSVATQSGVTASLGNTQVAGSAMSPSAGVGFLKINNVATATITLVGDAGLDRASVVTAINNITSQTGIKAVDTGDINKGVSLIADDGRNVTLEYGSTGSLSSLNTGLSGFSVANISGTANVVATATGASTAAAGDILTINGVNVEAFTLNETINSITTKINAKTSSTGVTATVVSANGVGYGIQLGSTSGNLRVTTSVGDISKYMMDATAITSNIASTSSGTYQLASSNGSAIQVSSTSNGTVANAGLIAGSFNANTSVATTTARSVATAAASTTTTGLLQAGTLRINGTSIVAASTGDDTSSAAYVAASQTAITSAAKAASAIAIASAINKASGTTGVTATAAPNAVNGTSFDNSTTIGTVQAANLFVNGVTVSLATLTASYTRGDVATLINNKTGETGVVATDNGRGLTLTAADGRNISLGLSSTLAANAVGITGASIGMAGDALTSNVATSAALSATTYSSVTLSSDRSFTVEGGSDGNANFALLGFKTGTFGGVDNGIKVGKIDITSQAGAQVAITALDAALKSVSLNQAKLGAFQNRLDQVVSNLTTMSQNMSASRSRVQDADYATETTNLAKSQIISQAATAMLAQANQSGQSVLALLK